MASARPGPRLDREFRRVIAGRSESRATAIGRVIGKTLMFSTALSGLAWVTIASAAGIAHIMFGSLLKAL